MRARQCSWFRMAVVFAGCLAAYFLLFTFYFLLFTFYCLPLQGSEPLPVRRVLIPADRVPAEMERVRQGVLVQLPREAFEAKVQRASQAGEILNNPPRLVEARYRANLVDAALVNGSAQWKVLNPASAAGVLAIEPFNLALQKARLDTADAILGDIGPRNLGLLVEQPGEHTLFLEWSARGQPARRAALRAGVAAVPTRFPGAEPARGPGGGRARYLPAHGAISDRGLRAAPLADRFRREVQSRSGDRLHPEVGSSPTAHSGPGEGQPNRGTEPAAGGI